MISGREPVEVKSNDSNVKSEPGKMIINKVPASLNQSHHYPTSFWRFFSWLHTQVSLPQTILIKYHIIHSKISTSKEVTNRKLDYR